MFVLSFQLSMVWFWLICRVCWVRSCWMIIWWILFIWVIKVMFFMLERFFWFLVVWLLVMIFWVWIDWLVWNLWLISFVFLLRVDLKCHCDYNEWCLLKERWFELWLYWVYLIYLKLLDKVVWVWFGGVYIV